MGQVGGTPSPLTHTNTRSPSNARSLSTPHHAPTTDTEHTFDQWGCDSPQQQGEQVFGPSARWTHVPFAPLALSTYDFTERE